MQEDQVGLYEPWRRLGPGWRPGVPSGAGCPDLISGPPRVIALPRSVTTPFRSWAMGSSLLIDRRERGPRDGRLGYTAVVTRGGLSEVFEGDIAVADAPLTVSAASVSGTAFSALSNVVVATFTDANPSGSVDDETAQIDWGDGTTSEGAISLSGGTFSVRGSHTYTNAGSFAITVYILHAGGVEQVDRPHSGRDARQDVPELLAIGGRVGFVLDLRANDRERFRIEAGIVVEILERVHLQSGFLVSVFGDQEPGQRSQSAVEEQGAGAVSPRIALAKAGDQRTQHRRHRVHCRHH